MILEVSNYIYIYPHYISQLYEVYGGQPLGGTMDPGHFDQPDHAPSAARGCYLMDTSIIYIVHVYIYIYTHMDIYICIHGYMYIIFIYIYT